MTGLIKRTTTNYNLRIPYFDVYGWGREMERNLDILDASLFGATSLGGIKGVWTNNTSYDVADRVVDADDSSIWQCLVAHTSPVTGSFADDRAANPTYWQTVTQTFNYRGQWTTATNYVVNDIVYLGYVWALARTTFTSSGSLAQDILDGNFVTLLDGTQLITDATAAKNAAELAETNAETAESNAELAESNAEAAQIAAELAESGAISAKNDAEDAQQAAEAAETLAEAWASNPEDSVVSGGLYSALHYAAKAADSENAAAIHASDASDSADAAALSESNAQTAETNAEIAQAAAEAAAANTVRFDIVQSKTQAQQGQARANLGGDVLAGFRNKTINGDFALAQRSLGGAFFGASFSAYQQDRWLYSAQTASGQFTVANVAHTLGQTDVPGNPKSFCRITGASLVTAANSGCFFQQRIEGVNTFAGKKVTLTFYAKASAAKKLGVALAQLFGSGGSPSTTVYSNGNVIDLTTAWQKFAFVIDVPSIAGKTLGSGGNDSLSAVFFISSLGTHASTNGLPSTVDDLGSKSIDISHVSLVEGDATAEDDPFSPRHIQQELALCQRYYEVQTQRVQNVSVGAGSGGWAFRFSYNVPKRTSPTTGISSASVSGAQTGTASLASNDAFGADYVASFSSINANGSATFTHTADAEL